jgi:hypothetical protein
LVAAMVCSERAAAVGLIGPSQLNLLNELQLLAISGLRRKTAEWAIKPVLQGLCRDFAALAGHITT